MSLTFQHVNAPALLLDAASPTLHTGLRATHDSPVVWRETQEETGVGLFHATEGLLRDAGLKPSDLHTIVFCDGPGSLLGIRLVAMVIRTWMALPRPQPLRVLAYHSLALVAADLLARGETLPLHVLSDARRDAWNVVTVSTDNIISDVRRCLRAELPPDTETLWFPDTFPHWQARPAHARPAGYRPQTLPEMARRFPLLRETGAPDAFMTEKPTYRTWTPASPA